MSEIKDEDGEDEGSKEKKNAKKSKKEKRANGKPSPRESGKSAIQLAREKFAAAKADKLAGINTKPSFKNGKGRGTGANAGKVGL